MVLQGLLLLLLVYLSYLLTTGNDLEFLSYYCL